MSIPQGAIDLFDSERGLFCVLVLVAITVLVVLGKIDGAMWLEFAKWLTVTLVASKTVTAAVESARKPTAETKG